MNNEPAEPLISLYIIRNLVNSKVYIGQTKHPDKRFGWHKSSARTMQKRRQVIHRAISKHGEANFTFELIATARGQENADETETTLIDQYDSRNPEHGYNIKPGGNVKGHSPETREKLRQANYRRGFVGDNHPWTGKKHTAEALAKMSEASKKLVGEANHFFGKEHSAETKAHWSAIRSGKRRLPEEKVNAIRADYERLGNKSEVARIHGVNVKTVYSVIQ